jgi:hypothetical protein
MDFEVDRLTNKAPDGEFKAYVLFDRESDHDVHTDYYGMRWDGGRKWDVEAGRENGIDMGDIWSSSSYTLRSFMDWVSYCSPSGHYCLVMNDHGKSYKGMCLENDMYYMTTDEISDTLKEFKRDRRMVDVVVLSACGMSTIEVLARLSPYTDHIVAPQQPTYSDHGLCTEKVLQNLKQYDWDSSPPSPFSVATDYVNGFIQESAGTRYDSTVCMIDTQDVNEFASMLNSTFMAIFNYWELLGECFSNAYDATVRTPGPELGEFENGDLLQFLENLRDEVVGFYMNPTARSVFNDLQECISLLDDITVYLHSIDDLNGINLYMPTEPVPTNVYGFMNWDYDGIYYRLRDYYRKCLRRQSGWEPYDPDDDEDDDFTPLDPVNGHVIDDDGDGLGNRVLINLTPEQDVDQQPFFRVMVDSLQFSGMGGGYLEDMLKKRIVLSNDDIEGSMQLEMKMPANGLYSIFVRVLDAGNNVVQKFLVGNFSMEEEEMDGSAPSLNITASDTTVTVGDEIDLTAVVSDPDGDKVDLIWDFDHRDGVLFDADETEVSTRYLRPGNVSVTCVAMDGEYTVVEIIDLVVEPAVGNNAPTAGMTSEVDEYGIVTLDAGALSSDPDEDMLHYKFNFGDGNWTDWMEEDEASHHYSVIGTYNCSIRVMDIRGAVSEREFLLVTVESVQNKTGEIDDDDDDETGTSDGINPVIIAVIIIVVILIILCIAGMVAIFLFLKIKKKEEDESWEDDDDEEAETW